MTSLSRNDAERLLHFVAEAESVGGDQPFTGEMLTELGQIVHADFVTYNELDRVRKRSLLYVPRPGDDDEGLEDDEWAAFFWDVVIEEHPVCVKHQQGDRGALKLSDFLTQRELHETRLYDVWFRPSKVEYELNVPIPSPLWHTKTFLFDRTGSRDFTERDRLVLDFLQPHLARMWQSARTRRLLGATLAELDRAGESDSSGVIFLGLGGELEFATPPARRLLQTFFPGTTRGRLPAAIGTWLEDPAAEPLCRSQGNERLTVERSGDTLLLREKRIEADLTAREREVLAWVARGKTNAEIARVLWLAPSTVRKHLENVYGKLGVTTRTAAVARFLGVIDAEAS